MFDNVDISSTWRGIRAMTRTHGHVNYALKISRGFWLCLWTPIWHMGRGPM